MKLLSVCSLVVAMACLTMDVSASHHHHHHHHQKNLRSHHKLLYKATPYDQDPASSTVDEEQKKKKEESCENLCTLHGFWSHQKGRNCRGDTSNSLCKEYTEAKSSMETVMKYAECEC